MIDRHGFVSAGLLLALVGFWLPWLAHPAAALNLNGYELAEWVTLMPEGQAGAAPLNRLTFLAPCACLTVLFGLAAARSRRDRARVPRSWLGWGLLTAALLSASAVFPYYPYFLTAPADLNSEFFVQFWVAAASLLAVAITFLLPDEANDLLQIALGLAGAGLAVWSLTALTPLARSALGLDWRWGPGWAAVLLGFAVVLVDGWRRLFRPRL